jgi:putative hydrolase of the HAD superfamily
MTEDLFFDLDRTLWDFESNSENALRFLYEKYNLNRFYPNFESFHNPYKKINEELWGLYRYQKIKKEVLRIQRFSDTLSKAGVNDIHLSNNLANDYVSISPRQTQLFPGTIEVLEDLKKDNYRLHIITNGFKEIQHIKLKNSGISDYFEVVLCSEEVGKNKPHHDVFNTALTRAKAKKKASYMIGDDYEADILGAKNVGMNTVLFDPHKKTINSKETTVINHLEDLKKVFNGF